MEKLFGLYGGKILSYDSTKKTAQVSVEPYTNGAENGITAKIAYPVGFDDQDTELSINGQPDVWIFFERGEFKNPVIAFFRTRQSSSVSDVFRLRHKQIELYAENIIFNGKTHTTDLATHDQDVIAGGVSLMEHGHGNVKNGDGITSKPLITSTSTDISSKLSQSIFSGITEQDSLNTETSKSDAEMPSINTTVEIFNEDRSNTTGKLKLWSGTVQANSTWTCDYSEAGFTQKPTVWANGIPLNGIPVFTSIDTINATITSCTGFAFTSTLDVENGRLATAECQVNVYAIGI